MKRALDGIRVLDLASYIAGPYCCMQLADHGAEVIRVEPPGGKVDREVGPFTKDGRSIPFGLTYQRNKKNITLNVRTEIGKKILYELVAKTDIVVHNAPKGTREGNTYDYERLSAVNPALIVVAVSGFGQTGPYAERPCFDTIAQAMSGSMTLNGYPGSPPLRTGLSYIDFNTGARAALGAMMALHERVKSGKGQLVDISLFDVAFSIVAAQSCPAEYRLNGEIRKAVGNCGFYAYSCSAPARDGYLMIVILGNRMWKSMCRLIEHENIIDDPRFKDNERRYRNYKELDTIIYEWIKDKTIAEAMALLDKADITCGPVHDIPASLEEPQIAAREMLVDMDYPNIGKVPIPGVSIKLSRTPGAIVKRASFLGEDNEDVYCGLLGYGKEDVANLKKEKAI